MRPERNARDWRVKTDEPNRVKAEEPTTTSQSPTSEASGHTEDNDEEPERVKSEDPRVNPSALNKLVDCAR